MDNGEYRGQRESDIGDFMNSGMMENKKSEYNNLVAEIGHTLSDGRNKLLFLSIQFWWKLTGALAGIQLNLSRKEANTLRMEMSFS